jgi:hypothetical protein
VIFVGSGDETQAQGGLADLAGAANKDHFSVVQIFADGFIEISRAVSAHD